MLMMKSSYLSSLLVSLLLTDLSQSLLQATVPPRGWNSYDSFCWTVSEEEFLRNAELVHIWLQTHGYEYVVVDYLWYRKKVEGAYVDSLGFDVIDEWGRMIPDPSRWPSSGGGKGFTEVAQIVHNKGLKFGIHVMRGISTQAVNANTPILDVTTGKPYMEGGRIWYSTDIGIKERPCGWMKNGFMSVNTTLGAGKAFLRSLYQQYFDWGVDFVKHDCVFGEDFDPDEISYVSEILNQVDKPILYSLSPGTGVTPDMAKHVNGLVNMYRVAGDDWDKWADLAAHFNIARDFAASNMIGATGLRGQSWPDLDMLPFGWLTDPGSNEGPHRECNLTLAEQRTQITLWAMSKSPMMFGGDVRKLTSPTLYLITNPTILEINAFSSNNLEAFVQSNANGVRAWIATGRKGEVYVAYFNLNEERVAVWMKMSELAEALGGKIKWNSTCKWREEWSGQELGVVQDTISTQVESHACALFVNTCVFQETETETSNARRKQVSIKFNV